MTIKEIKAKYANYHEKTHDDKTMFAVFSAFVGEDLHEEKFVAVVTDCKGYGKTVFQVVRVRDGAEMLTAGRCRPCDSLADSVDVASEMIEDK